MNISNLEQYVAQKNAYARIFGTPQLSLLKAEHRQRIASMIDADLSPENLTCDGELSRSAVQAKYRQLTRAAEELKSIDSTVEFFEYGC